MKTYNYNNPNTYQWIFLNKSISAHFHDRRTCRVHINLHNMHLQGSV